MKIFALDDDGQAMACCMIAPREDGDWEIMKFAARGMYTGTGTGSASVPQVRLSGDPGR